MMNKILNILMIDDDPVIGGLYQRILAKANYHVVYEQNPDAILRDYKKGIYDLVVTDYNMGVRNGSDILYKVKTTENIPVILVSAVLDLLGENRNVITRDEEIDICKKKFGFDGYVSKIWPDASAELVKTINEFLK